MCLVEDEDAVFDKMTVSLQNADIKQIVVGHYEKIALFFHVLRVVGGTKPIFLG